MQSRALKISCLFWVILIGGCHVRPEQKSKDKIAAEDTSIQIPRLKDELAAKQKQNEKLAEQLAVLRGFPADRLGYLVYVARIELGRFTQAYDDDKNDLDEGINVYLVLRDSRGDVIKGAGEVEIELWDLNEEEGGQFFYRWKYGMEEMSDYWLGGFLADNYKFKLTWPPGKEPRHSNLTLKLCFTDALTGEVFEIQKMIQVKIPGARR